MYFLSVIEWNSCGGLWLVFRCQRRVLQCWFEIWGVSRESQSGPRAGRTDWQCKTARILQNMKCLALIPFHTILEWFGLEGSKAHPVSPLPCSGTLPGRSKLCPGWPWTLPGMWQPQLLPTSPSHTPECSVPAELQSQLGRAGLHLNNPPRLHFVNIHCSPIDQCSKISSAIPRDH